jgi:hypothetical protein
MVEPPVTPEILGHPEHGHLRAQEAREQEGPIRSIGQATVHSTVAFCSVPPPRDQQHALPGLVHTGGCVPIAHIEGDTVGPNSYRGDTPTQGVG